MAFYPQMRHAWYIGLRVQKTSKFVLCVFPHQRKSAADDVCVHFENSRGWRKIVISENMDPTNSKLEGSNHDSPAREKLIALRLALLRVHKTLLEMERRSYEREHGHVNTGELF